MDSKLVLLAQLLVVANAAPLVPIMGTSTTARLPGNTIAASQPPVPSMPGPVDDGSYPQWASKFDDGSWSKWASGMSPGMQPTGKPTNGGHRPSAIPSGVFQNSTRPASFTMPNTMVPTVLPTVLPTMVPTAADSSLMPTATDVTEQLARREMDDGSWDKWKSKYDDGSWSKWASKTGGGANPTPPPPPPMTTTKGMMPTSTGNAGGLLNPLQPITSVKGPSTPSSIISIPPYLNATTRASSVPITALNMTATGAATATATATDAVPTDGSDGSDGPDDLARRGLKRDSGINGAIPTPPVNSADDGSYAKWASKFDDGSWSKWASGTAGMNPVPTANPVPTLNPIQTLSPVQTANPVQTINTANGGVAPPVTPSVVVTTPAATVDNSIVETVATGPATDATNALLGRGMDNGDWKKWSTMHDNGQWTKWAPHGKPVPTAHPDASWATIKDHKPTHTGGPLKNKPSPTGHPWGPVQGKPTPTVQASGSWSPVQSVPTTTTTPVSPSQWASAGVGNPTTTTVAAASSADGPIAPSQPNRSQPPPATPWTPTATKAVVASAVSQTDVMSSPVIVSLRAPVPTTSSTTPTLSSRSGKVPAKRLTMAEVDAMCIKTDASGKNDGSNWPGMDTWLSWEELSGMYMGVMGKSCYGSNGDNGPEHNKMIINAVEKVAQEVKYIDRRYILATIIQESGGCVHAKTTGSGGHPNPGLMQSYGKASCENNAACPQDIITQMVRDGVSIGNGGDPYGYLQLAQRKFPGNVNNLQAVHYYTLTRLYNSGPYKNYPNLNAVTDGTASYSRDIARRLCTGWAGHTTTL